jgi:hypothetical protein
MTDFHKTPIGQVFYGKHVPELIKELRRVADSLEKGNKIMLRESKLTKKASKLDEGKIKDMHELEKLEKDDAKFEKIKKIEERTEGGFKFKKDPDLSAIDD